ncbi:MAG: hypothetical protein QNJ16_13530 [Rhodobacter sp.]|nr:hypothetical protein [Rhodobacter sp.]
MRINYSLWPCKLASFVLALALIVKPALADDPLDAVRALTSALSELEASNSDLDTELENLLVQANKLLNPEIEEINRKLAVAADLIDTNADNAAIAGEVEKLRIAVAGYQNSKPEAHILQLTNSLIDALGQFGGEYAAATRIRLLALLVVLEDFESGRPVEAIARRAGRLNTLITTTSTVNTGEIVVSQLATLRGTLVSIEAPYYLRALGERIKEINPLLRVSAANRPPFRVSDITSLQSLKNTIDGLLPKATKSGIHVFSARYGRLSGPRDGGGSCDATPAMRKQCQGQTTCSLPANGVGVFCGGQDPAPFTQSRHKGVAVRYICLSADDATWVALLRQRPGSYAGHALTAVLRSTNDEIKCQ